MRAFSPFPSHLPASRLRCVSQRGASMVEFTVVALPVLLMGLGSIELSHWFTTRQMLSVALLEAGRAGSTGHNEPQRMIAAYEQAMLPLYAAASPAQTHGRLQQALQRQQHRLGAAPWRIRVRSPSAGAFMDFADNRITVAGAAGATVINNHYLAEQHDRRTASGWPGGRGPASGQTVFEANTLVLKLTWPHMPRLPLLRPLLRALGDPAGSYSQRALAYGYLPMTRQITLDMQSHPVQWSDDPGGKILFDKKPDAPGAPACRGWLCTPSASLPPSSPDEKGPDGLRPDHPQPDAGNSAEPGGPDGNPPGSGDAPPTGDGYLPPAPDADDGVAVLPDDPACGVTLCCAA